MFDFKKFREQNNLYQRDLAKALGVTQGYASRLELAVKELTEKQREILVNEYGEEAVSSCESEDDRAQKITEDTIISLGNSTNFGKGNNIEFKEDLVTILQMQMQQFQKQQEQMDRLITLLEEKLSC